jgi:hypothetical protein
MDARVAYAAHLLSRYWHKGEVKKALKERYGISARECETLLARARTLIRDRLGTPPEEHRCQSYSFYVSVLRDPAATLREKMLAQKRIDKLLGLELRGPAPFSTTGAGPDPFAEMRQLALQDPEARVRLARLGHVLRAGEDAWTLPLDPTARWSRERPGTPGPD